MEALREEEDHMSTVWTSYQGIEVVESDSKVQYRHPRTGASNLSTYPLEGASLLALADGVFLVVCDVKDCNFNGITGREPYVKPEGEQRSIADQSRSLFSHINGSHRRIKKPVVKATTKKKVIPVKPSSRGYSEAQIRVAIKVWLKWRYVGASGEAKQWTQGACDELTRLGLRPNISNEWTPDQLGSLVRKHIGQDKYKDIRTASMDSVLAEMVREAAAANADTSKNTVAATARITERKTPHQHTPVDFKKIVEAAEAAKAERREPEVKGKVSDTPTLSFVGRGSDYVEPMPTRTIATSVVEEEPVKPETTVKTTSASALVSDYEHILELDGTPVFLYRGTLMAGKPVKGIEV